MADFKRKDVQKLAKQLVDMIDVMRAEMAAQDATIQRQNAEIERLRSENDELHDDLARLLQEVGQLRDERDDIVTIPSHLQSTDACDDSVTPDRRLVLRLLNEIDRLQAQVAELLPHAVNDARNGISIGPAGPFECGPKCDHSCDDCRWYDSSVAFMARVDAGEFGEVAK